jgi:hypothetical protein
MAAFKEDSTGFSNLPGKAFPDLGDLITIADSTNGFEAAQATVNTFPYVIRSGDTMTGLLVLSGDPVSALGAVTKQYADAIASGLTVKEACFAATTADLNATYNNGAAGVGATLTNAGAMAAFSVDSISPPLNSRILVKDQVAQEENGIYTVTTVGSGAVNWVLTRATDYDQVADINLGDLVIVQNGDTNELTSWIESVTVTVIGTSPIQFTQFTTSPANNANIALSNLMATAINESLISDTDIADDLGSGLIRWANVYSENIRTGEGGGDALTLQGFDVDGATWVPFFTITAGNTPTGVLSGSVTGTTQAADTNNTTLATTAYADAIKAAKANVSLDNLAGVAINTTLVSDTDITDDLGSGTFRWKDLFASTIKTGTSAGNTVLLQAYDVDGAVYTTFGTLTANNTPTFALASAVTGVTQAALDNSTKLATTAYVDAATGGGAGANVNLSNLTAVAVNTSLISDTDITDDLGDGLLRWRDIYSQTLRTGSTTGNTLSIQARDVDGAVWTSFITLQSGNTPTCVLSGDVTGTTQAPSTNNTTLATTAYVDTATGGGSGANVMLSNLSSVAINTTLVSDTDITDDLGTQAIRWRNVYAQTLQTGDTDTDTLALSGWDVDGAAAVPFFTITAGNTPTAVLSGDVTGTTQAANDNSTKLATTAYVDTAVGSAGANTALSNLAAVAINTTLVSDTDITDDLGTQAIRWRNIYAQSLQTGDTAADTLTLSGWDVDGSTAVPFFTITAGNTPTAVLAGSVTGTTQAADTNNTTLATTAYADTIKAGKANTSLNNLAAVAINTSLVSDTDNTDDLGSGTVRWRDIYGVTLRTGSADTNSLNLQARDVDGAAWTTFITLQSGNTPTCVLASAVTGTTQAANDNSTKLATTAYADAIKALKANVALDNLAGVAINTSLISDTDITDDLGSQAIRWRNIYAATLQTGDTAADTLKLQGWDVDGGVAVDFITITANNTPTCALSGDVTGVTQSPGNNSTKLATTAYADAVGSSSGALVLLATRSASASATVDFDNVFSGTYDNYLLVFNSVVPATDGATPNMRIGTGAGPTYQTTNYRYASISFTTAATGQNLSAQAQDILFGGFGVGNAGGEGLNGTITIYNPSSTARNKYMTSTESGMRDTGATLAVAQSLMYESTTAATSIRFLMSSGNITSGTYRLYGYKNS